MERRTRKSGWNESDCLERSAHPHIYIGARGVWRFDKKGPLKNRAVSPIQLHRHVEFVFWSAWRARFIASLFITLCVTDRYRKPRVFMPKIRCRLNSKSDDFWAEQTVDAHNRYTTQPPIFNGIINFLCVQCPYLCLLQSLYLVTTT